MQGYNPTLAFSSHLPGTKPESKNNLTPKKRLNFPTQSPFAGRKGNQSKTP